MQKYRTKKSIFYILSAFSIGWLLYVACFFFYEYSSLLLWLLDDVLRIGEFFSGEGIMLPGFLTYFFLPLNALIVLLGYRKELSAGKRLSFLVSALYLLILPIAEKISYGKYLRNPQLWNAVQITAGALAVIAILFVVFVMIKYPKYDASLYPNEASLSAPEQFRKKRKTFYILSSFSVFWYLLIPFVIFLENQYNTFYLIFVIFLSVFCLLIHSIIFAAGYRAEVPRVVSALNILAVSVPVVGYLSLFMIPYDADFLQKAIIAVIIVSALAGLVSLIAAMIKYPKKLTE